MYIASLICVRSPLLTKSRLISSLSATEMFHFAEGLKFIHLFIENRFHVKILEIHSLDR